MGPATPADIESISGGKPGLEAPEAQQAAKTSNVETDYPFAKFNIRVPVPKYNSEEYQQHLQDSRWSKEETDYLMELALDYDLRWIVISDRYDFPQRNPPGGSNAQVNGGNGANILKATNSSSDQDVKMGDSENFQHQDSSTLSHPDQHLQQVRDALVVQSPSPRTMEEMKSRYYTVAAKIMALRTPLSNMSSTEFELHEKMTKFNPNSEQQRKDIASKLLSRDPLEIQEEELLLTELKRIVQNEDKLIQERKELYERLEAPPSSGNIAVYQSSQGLQQLMQQLLVADRNKKRRSLTGPNEANSSPATAPQTGDSRNPTSATTDRGQRGSQPSSATTKRPMSGLNPNLRRLSRAEEARFGIQHHERITSGVTFRTARVDKLITAKSTAQSQKVTAALTELGIPPRLLMPTAKICTEFEKLISHIQTLLDVRKMCEKSEGEVRVLKQMKEDYLNGEGKTNDSSAVQKETPNEEGESKLNDGDTKMNGVNVEDDAKNEDEGEKDSQSVAEPEEEADDEENVNQSEDEEDAEADMDDEEEEEVEDDDDGEGEMQNLDIDEEDGVNSDPGADASDEDVARGNEQSEEEEDEDNESEDEDAKSKASVALSTRSSRARTKRSASLMSSTSRQSSKRQRKQ